MKTMVEQQKLKGKIKKEREKKETGSYVSTLYRDVVKATVDHPSVSYSRPGHASLARWELIRVTQVGWRQAQVLHVGLREMPVVAQWQFRLVISKDELNVRRADKPGFRGHWRARTDMIW